MLKKIGKSLSLNCLSDYYYNSLYLTTYISSRSFYYSTYWSWLNKRFYNSLLFKFSKSDSDSVSVCIIDLSTF